MAHVFTSSRVGVCLVCHQLPDECKSEQERMSERARALEERARRIPQDKNEATKETQQ